MKIVYALLYNTGVDHFDISGVYNSLESAKAAVVNGDWQPNAWGQWEIHDELGKLWAIEAHGLQD